LIFETRTEGNSKQSKIFLDFFKYQTENREQSKPKLETKKANKEKQRKYFWSFYILERRNKNENNKESETWIYKGPTKYNM
jgi:hypothetical protein